MFAVKDIISGQKPNAMDLPYNGDDDADSTTLRYKGSLVKATDFDNANGYFLTWGGESTAYENIFGILEEEQSTAAVNFLPDDALYGMRTRKIRPIAGTTIVRGEYTQNDPAGTTNLATGATGSAASSTLTSGETYADVYTSMGAWIYFTNGANANYLHYIEAAVDNTIIEYGFGKAMAGAVVSTDDFIFIQTANTRFLDFCAHEVTLVSTELVASRTVPVFGLMNYVTDVGIPLQKLDRDKHDGLKLVNPRFYHDFLLIGSVTLTNIFTNGVIAA